MFKLLLVLAVSQLILASEEPDRFIVGGAEALRGQFPYVVSFRYFPYTQHGCSGSIVSSRWILTAAHCIHRRPPFEMVVGTNEVSDFGTRLRPVEVVVHPNFRFILNPFLAYDIGLVKTEHLIEFNELIQPIGIGRQFITRSFQTMVAGFGATEMFPGDPSAPIWDERYPQMSENLKFIRLNLISNLQCNTRISLQLISGEVPRFAIDQQMCTYNNIQEGLCFGDSGSALLLHNEVIGIAIRSVLPCARGMPDVYTRVSHFTDWIDSHISSADVIS